MTNQTGIRIAMARLPIGADDAAIFPGLARDRWHARVSVFVPHGQMTKSRDLAVRRDGYLQ
ncbi:hypothetical protein ACVK00_000144 [Burkholderia sp. PvR073]|uniref:hypothetical protein n=1 Tax=Burkholderia TaxID=32008 RepID=UPI00254E389B|nr:hypothetical protein [Burkholderia sp. lyk4-R2A-23]